MKIQQELKKNPFKWTAIGLAFVLIVVCCYIITEKTSLDRINKLNNLANSSYDNGTLWGIRYWKMQLLWMDYIMKIILNI